MLYCLSRANSWSWSSLSLSVDPEDFLVSVGVIIFSYTSQIFLPPLEGSMEDRGQFNAMLGWTHGAACITKTMFSLLVSDIVWNSTFSCKFDIIELLFWVCDESERNTEDSFVLWEYSSCFIKWWRTNSQKILRQLRVQTGSGRRNIQMGWLIDWLSSSSIRLCWPGGQRPARSSQTTCPLTFDLSSTCACWLKPCCPTLCHSTLLLKYYKAACSQVSTTDRPILDLKHWPCPLYVHMHEVRVPSG